MKTILMNPDFTPALIRYLYLPDQRPMGAALLIPPFMLLFLDPVSTLSSGYSYLYLL